jgi:hypothetical protein
MVANGIYCMRHTLLLPSYLAPLPACTEERLVHRKVLRKLGVVVDPKNKTIAKNVNLFVWWKSSDKTVIFFQALACGCACRFDDVGTCETRFKTECEVFIN